MSAHLVRIFTGRFSASDGMVLVHAAWVIRHRGLPLTIGAGVAKSRIDSLVQEGLLEPIERDRYAYLPTADGWMAVDMIAAQASEVVRAMWRRHGS